MTLIDEEIDVKAFVDWCDEINEFVLDINGQPFESHVYIEPNYNPDDLKLKFITATVAVNQKKIIDDEMTQEWSANSMQNAFYDTI